MPQSTEQTHTTVLSTPRFTSGLLGWLFLLLAIVLSAALLLLLADLRRELRRASETVNQKLPEILEKTHKSADALAELSADIKQLRDLAGMPDGVRDRTLAAYADAVLDSIQASGGTIGTKGMIGNSLKDPQPAAEWCVAARKEAVWLTFRAKSRAELLQRLCQTKFGSDWQIQLPNQPPMPLAEWVKAKHPPEIEGL